MSVPKPSGIKAIPTVLEPLFLLLGSQRHGVLAGHGRRWGWGLKQLVIELLSPHPSRGVGEVVPPPVDPNAQH